MRILCLSYEFPPLGGGGARVAQGLIRALAAAGDRIDLLTMGYRNLPRLETDGPVSIRRTAPFRLRPRICSAIEMMPYVALATVHARSCLRRQPYALVHAHFVFPDGLIAWLIKQMAGLRYVITAHGSDVPGYNPDRFAAWHVALRPLWTKVTSGAAAIVCPSRTLQTLVQAANAEAAVTVIPNGFDSSRLVPSQHKRDRILVVTRMFARKGVRYLLEALARMPSSCEVLIVGDGPELPALRRRAAELRSPATFVGALDNDSPELKALYETSRIFVLPSAAENFPVVLLEAMAAGCAILTTRDTGCEEVIGDAAMLVAPGDVEGLAAALRELMHDRVLCARLGQAARERLQQNFEWPLVAARYRALFHSVAAADRHLAARCESA